MVVVETRGIFKWESWNVVNEDELYWTRRGTFYVLQTTVDSLRPLQNEALSLILIAEEK